MDKIVHQVARVRRLLWLQSALQAFPFWLFIAFAIGFVGMLIPKITYIPITFESWGRNWLIGSSMAALGITGLVTWLRRPSLRQSAIELDRRFGLRERISSALDLPEKDRETPIGSALLLDAIHKSERIDVRDQFSVKMSPKLPWALLPLVASIALFWVPDAELFQADSIVSVDKERLNNVKAQTKPILAQVKKLRTDLEEKGLQEAADEFKKLEKKLEDLQKADTSDIKKLLTDFNEIKKEMEQRKDAMGTSDELKKAMENLKKIDQGPGDKFADSLKNGDYKEAKEQVNKLLEKLKSNNLTKEQQEQLAKQLEQMKKAIEEGVQKQKDALEQLKQELQKAEQSGDLEKSAQIRKKMEKLENALQKAQKACEMCDKMGKASQAMKDGNQQMAQQALDELSDQLEQMETDSEAMSELEEMMSEMQNAKQSSNCKSCNGQGCAKCNSDKAGPPKKNAKGEGKGSGEREETETETKEFDSQVRDQVRKGETVVGGKVGGPNRKGLSREETREAILNAAPEDPDAIESITLPKAQRDQQREYFDKLRDR